MSTQATNRKENVEQLLRVEMSAARAYGLTVRKLGNSACTPKLVDLKHEHDTAVGSLRNLLARLHHYRGAPRLGALGKIARGVQRVATMFGPAASLRTLLAGESTLADYLRRVAQDDDLPPEARQLVADELLPGARRRAHELDRLITWRFWS